MSHNWAMTENSQVELQKIMKRRKKIGKMIKHEYQENEIYDPLKDVVLVITEASDSTLNRILKSINAMYRSSDPADQTTRACLVKQKLAIEKELMNRRVSNEE